MYVVYVLSSLSHKFQYSGMSSDLERRFSEHNLGKVKSTKAYKPFSIIYKECFETSTEARKREKYLKTAAGRRFRKKLI